MPISLIGIAGAALYIFLLVKFKLTEKFGFLAYIGLPVFVVLFMLFLYWIGVPIDNSSDQGECVKWNWSTGECTKYE